MLEIIKNTNKGINAKYWDVREIHIFDTNTIVRLYGYASLEALQSYLEPITIVHFDITNENDPLKQQNKITTIAALATEGNKVGVVIGKSLYEDYIISLYGWQDAIKS